MGFFSDCPAFLWRVVIEPLYVYFTGRTALSAGGISVGVADEMRLSGFAARVQGCVIGFVGGLVLDFRGDEGFFDALFGGSLGVGWASRTVRAAWYSATAFSRSGMMS